MSRDYITSQRLIAVSLAVIMLVSVGAVAFAGSAAATGGTYDTIIEEEVEVSNDLNVGANGGTVSLLGPNADDLGTTPNNNDTYVDDDGSIEIDESGSGLDNDKFSGVGIGLDRVNQFDSVQSSNVDPGNQATFLSETVEDFTIEQSGGASPAVFIEFDPQSDFSQITGSVDESYNPGDVEGSHDNIIIAEESTIDDFTDITPDDDDNVVAISVDNEADADAEYTGTDYTVIAYSTSAAGSGGFDEVIGELQGSSESDLQDKNIDNAQLAAGVFGSSDAVVEAVQLNGVDAAGETLHSEKITLENPNNDDRYFNSIVDAHSAAAGGVGESIVVDRGVYGPDANGLETGNEDNPITITKSDITIEADTQRTAASESMLDRINDDGGIDTTSDEAIIGLGITNTNDNDPLSGSSVADDFTVDGVVVEGEFTPSADGTAADVDDDMGLLLAGGDGAAPTLQNSIVDFGVDDAEDTAIQFRVTDGQSALSGTIEDNAVLANDQDFEDSDIGLDVDPDTDVSDFTSATISSNYFSGFETQVEGTNDLNMNSVLSAHETEFNANVTQAAVAEDSSGNVLGDVIPGSIAVADGVSGVNTIDVYNGDYEEAGNTLSISNAVTVTGAGDSNLNADVTLNNNNDITFEQFDIPGSDRFVEVTSSSGDTDINTITFEDNITAGNDVIDVTAADGNVDVSGITATLQDSDTNRGIVVDSSASDVTVKDSTINLFNSGGGTYTPDGVVIGPDGDLDVNSAEVSGVTVQADSSEEVNNGIKVDVLNADPIDVTGNIIEIGDSGTGLVVDEDAGQNINIDDNEVRGGTSITALDLAVDQADDTTFSLDGNVFIGENVESGTGINAPDVASPLEGAADANTPTVISGFEELVVADTGLSTSSFDGVESAFNLGTHADLRDDAATPRPPQIGGGQAVLYGSLENALDDVTNNGSNDVDYNLEVTDTDVGVSNAPEDYDHGSDEIAIDDTAEVTIEGQGKTDADPAVIAGDNTVGIDIGTTDGALNNPTIRNLPIEYTGAGPAIRTDQQNAQVTLDTIAVDATDASSGFAVTDAAGDVNVVTITDSEFLVDSQADGIVLSSSADDRAGFDITNTEIRSEGLTDSGTAIDVSNVEKPGKQDPDLNTEFTIQGNTFDSFATHIDLNDGTFTYGGTDNTQYDDNADLFQTIRDGNTYEQSVIIQNESGDDAATNATLLDNGGNVIFGDIETAVSETNGVGSDGANEVTNVTLDAAVESGAAFNYSQTLEIGTTSGSSTTDNEVTVEGADDIEILGDVTFDGVGSSDDVTFTNFDIVADDETVGSVSGLSGTVEVDADTDDNDNLETIRLKEADSAFDLSVVTITGADTGDDNLEVNDVSVAHDIAYEGTDNIETLLVDDAGGSDFESGTDVRDVASQIDNITANVTGVEVASGFADGNDDGDTVTLSGVDISANGYKEPNRGGVLVDGGENGDTVLNIEDSTIDVAANGTELTSSAAGSEINVDNTDITADEDLNSLIQADKAANERFGPGAAVAATDVNSGALDVTVKGGSATSDSDNSADDAVSLVQDDSGIASYEVNGVDVAADGGVGIDIKALRSTDVSVINGTAVDATAANATDIRESNGDAKIELKNSSFESAATALYIAEEVNGDFQSADEEIRGNAFVGEDHDILIEDEDDFGGTVDVARNFIGSESGPNAPSAAGITVAPDGDNDPIYDPFLTTGPGAIDASEDPAQTPDFAHDVIIPADGTFTSVGFPAQPAEGSDTIGDAFNTNSEGVLYAWNNTAEQFEIVEATGDGVTTGTPIDAFDAFIMQNTGDNESVARITYQSDENRSAFDQIDNQYDFEGLNFVAPQQIGTVDNVLFPGADTDFVSAPYGLGENLYGDSDATQVSADIASPDAAGFSENFRSGVGDRVVHPHAGYFVVVNDESNQNLTVGESIPTPDEPTTSSIESRTDATSAGIFEINGGTAANNSNELRVSFTNDGTFDDTQTVTLTNADNATSVEKDVTLNAGETSLENFDNELTIDTGDTIIVTTNDDSIVLNASA